MNPIGDQAVDQPNRGSVKTFDLAGLVVIQIMKKLESEQLKVGGDIPSPKFGHSFTLVSPSKAILFGGAIGQSGKFIITNDAYLFDFTRSLWKRLASIGDVPSARAAHSASGLDNQEMLLFGGAASGTGGGLSDDQLYHLQVIEDKKQAIAKWKILPIDKGKQPRKTPGRRYGHAMVFNKPNLIVIGGNVSVNPGVSTVVCDVWTLNMDEQPYSWNYISFAGEVPAPRVYHTAALCQHDKTAGMVVIFGGRKDEVKKAENGEILKSQIPLNDCWGLRRHRNGQLDWVKAPATTSLQPLCRFQHQAQFVGPYMFVVGGRTSGANLPENSHFEDSTSMIDVYDTNNLQWLRFEGLYRYRHALVGLSPFLYVHGGFNPMHPVQPLNSIHKVDIRKIVTLMTPEPAPAEQKKDNRFDDYSYSQSRISRFDGKSSAMRQITPSRCSKNIQLSNQVVVATTVTVKGQNVLQIQKISVNSLPQQAKKLIAQPSISLKLKQNSLADMFLSNLLTPSKLSLAGPFSVKKEYILKLCEQAIKIAQSQQSLLVLRQPIKIFGNIFGRYTDLLRFFDSFGTPDDHQLQSYDYLFLGNYLNKGSNSLETICLVLALYIKSPEQFFLLRGAFDDIRLCKIFGFGEQCSQRLGENIADPNSIFNIVCKTLEFLPLAALVDDRILCTHGGIGDQIKTLQHIQQIKRPCAVAKRDRAVVDLLWSDFGLTDGPIDKSRDLLSLQPYKFTEKKLRKFLNQNQLQMLIRSHQTSIEGFQTLGSQLVSISSCTGYGGRHSNMGCCLKLTKNDELVPLLIPAQKGDRAWINEHKPSIFLSQEQTAIRKRAFSPPRKILG